MHLLVAHHIKFVSSKKIVQMMNNKLKIIIPFFVFD